MDGREGARSPGCVTCQPCMSVADEYMGSWGQIDRRGKSRVSNNDPYVTRGGGTGV